MPTNSKPVRIPKMTHHKGRDLARVRLGGRDVYLGKWGSPEARSAYDRAVAEWLANGRMAPTARRGGHPGDLTITQLVVAYANDVEPKTDPRVWAGTIKPSLRRLCWLYGDLPAAELSPAKLRTLMLWSAAGCGGKARPLSRGYINSKLAPRVRGLFKWAMQRELVPASVWHALTGVDGLNHGEAPSRPKVQPVADAVVDATLPYLPAVVRDMVRLQRLTGMRPGEVCGLTWGEVDRSGEVWFYKPMSHKTAHHGHDRTIAIGPRAQALLVKYLSRDDDAPLFSPAESEAKRKAELRARRKTAVQPSQIDRRAEKPKRKPGNGYSTPSYGAAIARAVKAAFRPEGMSDADFEAWKCPQHWAPNQIRHTAATAIRKGFGLDAAGAVLGHSKIETTQVYAEREYELAVRVAREVG